MLRSKRTRLLLSLVSAVLALSVANVAGAKATHDSPYSYGQTFGTSLRLLKVDLKLEVTEANHEWGYLLFRYQTMETRGRQTSGSIELVRRSNRVRITVKIPSMPSYHERMLVKKLVEKLAEEHGPPVERKPPTSKPKPDQPDAARKPSPKARLSQQSR